VTKKKKRLTNKEPITIDWTETKLSSFINESKKKKNRKDKTNTKEQS